MPHTIPPFAEIRLPNGCTRFPGNLPRIRAVQIKAIHNQLRADVSHHPEQEEQLVCRAFQQCYDAFWRFHQHGGAPYTATAEAELGEKVFRIAQECKWLPEGACTGNPAWRGWVHQLIAGRYKWTGFEDCSQPDPYLFVPFPKETGGAEVLEILGPAQGYSETNVSGAEDPVAVERQQLMKDFKAKARKQRIKVTDEMVAKAAKPGKWNDRTMVTWWKRNDKRCEPLHDRLIRAVLAKDPRSLWSPKPPK
jgi:hypothetical protein